MAAKSFEEWVPFLNDVLAYWDQNDLPATAAITMGGKDVTRADIVAMRDKFIPYDERIKKIERELEKAQDERTADASGIQSLGVDFLSAMKGRFGASSQQAQNCPVVTKRRSSAGRASGTEVKVV